MSNLKSDFLHGGNGRRSEKKGAKEREEDELSRLILLLSGGLYIHF